MAILGAFLFNNQMVSLARPQARHQARNFDSMETILRAIAHGFERRELKEMCRT